MEELKTCLLTIMDRIENKKNSEAFETLNKNIALIQNFILLLVDEGVIPEEDAIKLSEYVIQAMENRDGLLLFDVTKYALFSIYQQLFPEEE